jgi:peptide-methionine (S)-S-oxide reductase
MTEQATLAGGCFWCLEAVYDELAGVSHVKSGYMGGHLKTPSYEDVCEGTTGHAEVVQITYDPAVINFAQLLEIFFVIHDPTTLNRQGNDVGTQYRSAIFFHSPEQESVALATVKKLNESGIWGAQAVTEIVPLAQFYPAEAYHDDYFARNPNAGYCQFIVAPKVAKARKVFFNRLKK